MVLSCGSGSDASIYEDSGNMIIGAFQQNVMMYHLSGGIHGNVAEVHIAAIDLLGVSTDVVDTCIVYEYDGISWNEKQAGCT